MTDHRTPENKDPQEKKPRKEFSIKLPKKNTSLVILSLLIIFILSFQIRIDGFHNPDGTTKWPYLRNIDSYAYYADVELMLRGEGSFAIGNRLHQILTFSAYRLIVGSEVTTELLTEFMIWWPAFIISLAVIPGYYIGRYLYDRKAGVLTAFFLVMSPNIATRTLAGDPDSDVLVLFMATLSIALLAIALKKFDMTKLLKKGNLFYGILAGVGTGLFALTWPGYWFVFFIAIGVIVLKIIITIVRHIIEKKPLSDSKGFAKSWGFHLLLYLIGFWIITVPIMGPAFVANPALQIGLSADLFGGGGIKSEGGSFPNVYVSVAELQQGGQAGAVINRAAGVEFSSAATGIDPSLLGLLSPFIFAMIAFIYLFYSYAKRKEHLDTILVLGLWMIGMLYSAIVAVRFGIFLAPVISVPAAIALSMFWNFTFKKEEVSE